MLYHIATVTLINWRKSMSQKIYYHAPTETHISLMSDKLTDTVGNTVFPFHSDDKDKQREFFDQMLEDLLYLTSKKKHYLMATWTLETIKALLSKLD
jgi:hypothetical protein